MSFDLQSLPFICSNLQNEPEERSHASKPVSVFKERVKKCNWQSNDSLYVCVFSPGLIPTLLFLFVRGGKATASPQKSSGKKVILQMLSAGAQSYFLLLPSLYRFMTLLNHLLIYTLFFSSTRDICLVFIC